MDDRNGFYGVELCHVQHFTTFWGVEPVQHHHWITAISVILEGAIFLPYFNNGGYFPQYGTKQQCRSSIGSGYITGES